MTYRITKEVFSRDVKSSESRSLPISGLKARPENANDYDESGDDIRKYLRVQIMTQLVGRLDETFHSDDEASVSPAAAILIENFKSSERLETSCPHCPAVFAGGPVNQRRNLLRHLFESHSVNPKLLYSVPECTATLTSERIDFLQRELENLQGLSNTFLDYNSSVSSSAISPPRISVLSFSVNMKRSGS